MKDAAWRCKATVEVNRAIGAATLLASYDVE